MASNVTGVAVVHGAEAYLRAECDAFPYLIRCHDEVGEAFADLSKTGKGRYVLYSETEKDFAEDLARDCGDWTGWRWRKVCLWFCWGYGEL